jgi:hypothetical protein
MVAAQNRFGAATVRETVNVPTDAGNRDGTRSRNSVRNRIRNMARTIRRNKGKDTRSKEAEGHRDAQLRDGPAVSDRNLLATHTGTLHHRDPR